jgi:hypothetical protein
VSLLMSPVGGTLAASTDRVLDEEVGGLCTVD